MSANPDSVQNENISHKKYQKKWACATGVIIGLLMLICGMFSATGDKDADLALISGGTTSTCIALIDECDDAAYKLNIIADVIEVALSVRENNSPDKLNEFINAHFLGSTSDTGNTAAIVQAVMVYVNSAYKKSATEEEYLEKLKAVASGIRTAISSRSQVHE